MRRRCWGRSNVGGAVLGEEEVGRLPTLRIVIVLWR